MFNVKKNVFESSAVNVAYTIFEIKIKIKQKNAVLLAENYIERIYEMCH